MDRPTNLGLNHYAKNINLNKMNKFGPFFPNQFGADQIETN